MPTAAKAGRASCLWEPSAAPFAWVHSGKGQYLRTEEAIQAELRQVDALRELPVVADGPAASNRQPSTRVMVQTPESFPGGSWQRPWTAGTAASSWRPPTRRAAPSRPPRAKARSSLSFDGASEPAVTIGSPALYALTVHESHESHAITLRPTPGLRIWSISFAAGVPDDRLRPRRRPLERPGGARPPSLRAIHHEREMHAPQQAPARSCAACPGRARSGDRRRGPSASRARQSGGRPRVQLLAKLPWQHEANVLVDGAQLQRLRRHREDDEGNEALDQLLGCAGAGGDVPRRAPSATLPRPGRGCRSGGRRRRARAPPLPAVGVRGVCGANHQHQVALVGELLDGDLAVCCRSRCRRTWS